jgi:hypothetical protein
MSERGRQWGCDLSQQYRAKDRNFMPEFPDGTTISGSELHTGCNGAFQQDRTFVETVA